MCTQIAPTQGFIVPQMLAPEPQGFCLQGCRLNATHLREMQSTCRCDLYSYFAKLSLCETSQTRLSFQDGILAVHTKQMRFRTKQLATCILSCQQRRASAWQTSAKQKHDLSFHQATRKYFVQKFILVNEFLVDPAQSKMEIEHRRTCFRNPDVDLDPVFRF